MIAIIAKFPLIPFTRTLKVKPAFRQVRQVRIPASPPGNEFPGGLWD
ncbi:hypothetical protein QUA26_15900 [Microcoleus sp. Pol12A4]